MLVRCLYASRPVEPQAQAVLDAILKTSRTQNPRHGVTGMLCFGPAVFVQVLEGGRTAINRLLTNLYRDQRHAGIEVMDLREIAERQFGDWTMGHIRSASINPALLLKYSARAELDPFAMPAASTLTLLAEIAASGALANAKT